MVWQGFVATMPKAKAVWVGQWSPLGTVWEENVAVRLLAPCLRCSPCKIVPVPPPYVGVWAPCFTMPISLLNFQSFQPSLC